MMDQNRCLLDVINDPQLLQSFLESAPTTNINSSNNTAAIVNADSCSIIDNNANNQVSTSSFSQNNNDSDINNFERSSDNDVNDDNLAVTSVISSILNGAIDERETISNGDQLYNTSDDNFNDVKQLFCDSSTESRQNQYAPNSTTNLSTPIQDKQKDTINNHTADDVQTFLPNKPTNRSLDINSFNHNNNNINSNAQDNKEFTSTVNPPKLNFNDNENSQQQDHIIAHRNTHDITSHLAEDVQKFETNSESYHQDGFQNKEAFSDQSNAILNGPADNNSKNEKDQKILSVTSTSSPIVTSTLLSNSFVLNNSSPQVNEQDVNTPVTTDSSTALPQASPIASLKSPEYSVTPSPATSNNTIIDAATKPAAKKRPPRKSSTKPPKGKNVKLADPSPNPSPSMKTSHTMPLQPGSQQIVFQNPTTGLRQPAILSSPLNQSLGGLPQQQKLIQIQTANGPMYFAIAPGPAAINNSMVNQTGMQSQQYQSQQICFQQNSVMINRPPIASGVQQQHQKVQGNYISNNLTNNASSSGSNFVNDQQSRNSPIVGSLPRTPQQQLRFQNPPVIQYGGQQVQPIQVSTSVASSTNTSGTSSIHMQRPSIQQFSNQGSVIMQTHPAQNFQQSMTSQSNTTIINGTPIVSQQQQSRLTSPVMAGHPITVNSSQSGSSQQHITLPTSQSPVVMPRMPNQIILNRPTQLLPGQQQFIQIQTQNGPMLLALPSQPAQPLNNSMIDYNTQAQQQKQQKVVESTSTKSTNSNDANAKNNTQEKSSDFDLSDLLLEHGILPEDKNSSSQASMDSKIPLNTQSTQMLNTQVPIINSTLSSQPRQTVPTLNHQPLQQPIRIALSADGQMIVQQQVYGDMRPVMASPMINSNTVMPSQTSMLGVVSNDQNNMNVDTKSTDPKFKAGKGSTVKRSRSKKSEIDKFPTLKTPKRQQQQQQQQQMQAVTALVPINVFVDQSKVIGSSSESQGSSEVGKQQVALAKIVSPVVNATTIQQVQSIQSQGNITQNHTTCVIGQNSQLYAIPSASVQANQNSGNGLKENIKSETSSSQDNAPSVSSSSSIAKSCPGNVTTHLLTKIVTNSVGASESNSQSNATLMPKLALTVDTSKTDPNTVRTHDGIVTGIKVGQGTGSTIALVLHQAPQPTALQIKQQQAGIRAQAILKQLASDQNAVLNPQTDRPFESVKDACNRLIKYHLFDRPTVTESQLDIADELFEITAEKLISKKADLYNKFRLMILKQSMETVPTCEDLMIDQILLAEEQSQLKREREMLEEFQAHVENGHGPVKDFKVKKEIEADDCGSEFMLGFGDSSPKCNINDEQDSIGQSKQVDEWLMPDKWNKSYLLDNEASLAIESILDDD